jgi:hypothetical protein
MQTNPLDAVTKTAKRDIKMSEWISVEDRLPITRDYMIDLNSNFETIDVICFDGYVVYPDTFKAGNTAGFWCEFESDDQSYQAIYWMPLPEPPKT